MQPFSYARPATVAEAVAILDQYGPDARVLAGGTDLIIGLRDGTIRPAVVVDLKRIAEFRPPIREEHGCLTFSAVAVMTDIAAHPTVRRSFAALSEAARVVGSVQIRNRATLAGNICNGSPAADTAPPLMVYGATVVTAGPGGARRIPIADFLVGSGETALRRGELVTAVELPLPTQPVGSSFRRLTRRRGTDLASVTMCVSVDRSGVTRLAYGSVGPRPYLVVDETGLLADPGAPSESRDALLDSMFSQASPSPRSMRAGPAYRLAMLRVLGARALETAIARLAEG
jgi:carbon-monoxide dehydrogenase medium subunit